MMTKVLGNLKRGRLFILSAPAGTGKTTLVDRLVLEFPCIIQSISYTTRDPRPGEVQGVNYHFISEEEFRLKVIAGEFLEHVKLYGKEYGTSQKWVQTQLEQGKHVVLVIDTQGALLLKDRVEATYIFIAPPSFEELERRLVKRNTESSEHISERLKIAEKEIEAQKNYDYAIVNHELSVAYDVLKSIIIAEEHKINPKEQTPWKKNF